MKMIGRELQERNRYIGVLNKSEADINYVLYKLQIEVINPTTVVKQKMHEMEELFHQQEMEFYTNFALGQIIRDFLLWYLFDIINTNFQKMINFESLITIKGSRLPIKNPFIENFNKKIDKVRNFKIDETLPESLGKYITVENIPNILLMEDDLVKLGYSDFAENAVERTLKELQQKEENNKKNIHRFCGYRKTSYNASNPHENNFFQ